jgi:hypothetical protein
MKRIPIFVIAATIAVGVSATHLANHIRASSREEWAAPTGQTHDRTRPQSSPRQKVLDRKAPSTHDWSERTARRYMQVARSAKLADLNVPISSLYQLTAPSTPPTVRDAVVKKAKTTKVTHQEVTQAVTAAKPVSEKPRTVVVQHTRTTSEPRKAVVQQRKVEPVSEPKPDEAPPNFLLFTSRVEAHCSFLFEREPEEWRAAIRHKADMPAELRDRVASALKAVVDQAIAMIAEFEETRTTH